MTNTNVNFEVTSMGKANKAGYVVAQVKFENKSKPYTFVRREYNGTTVIDGCRVYFDENYEVIMIEREYETKGIEKADTSNIGSKTSEKIKTEMEAREIELPKVEIKAEDFTNESGEIHHEKYEQIKTCLECNIPVYLSGPAGSGKNHTVEQIAKELGWDFYFSNSVQQEYKLTGFIDAGGEFHETEFYKACTSETDCIFS